MFRLSRNERSHWSGNGVHVEPESVFMIGRNMQEQVNNVGLLILDDWGMEMLDAAERSNLLEIIDTRYGRVSTVVASQLPVEKWYGMIGEATFAEAILDRLIHRAVRVGLTGESMRKQGINLTDADQAE